MSKARELADLGSAYSDGALSNRNLIINGNFDVWQRGTSGTSGYVADRWLNARNNTAQTLTQRSFSLGQTDVPNEPKHYIECAVTSVAGALNAAILQQLIESVRTFAGQTVTLSFWAKADASKDIAVEFEQNFGTGGSPSSSVNGIGVTTCALTTSWQKFTVTATIPSISGKTIGTDGNDFLRVNFWFDAGSDYDARTNSLGQQSGTFDIAQVQLEVGDTATPFEHRSYGQELALCQRYFIKLGGDAPADVYGAGYITGSGFILDTLTFPVKMRAIPTATKVGTWNVTNVAQPSVAHIGSSTLVFYAPGTVVGQGVYWNPFPTAYLTFDAEL